MSTPALLVRTALPRSRIKPGTRPCPGLLRLRQTVLPISIGITSGLVALTHQRPMRLDAAVQQQTRTLATNPPKNKEDGRFLSAETVKQLSRGSLAGIVELKSWAFETEMTLTLEIRLFHGVNGERLLQDTCPAGRNYYAHLPCKSRGHAQVYQHYISLFHISLLNPSRVLFPPCVAVNQNPFSIRARLFRISF